MAKVAYKVGEIYLCKEYTDRLYEKEILDVSNDAKAIKTDRDDWIDATVFHDSVKAKLGVAVYSNLPWPFNKRKVIKNN